MSHEKEEQEINELYPEGSIERHVLEYSRGKPTEEELPRFLVAVFGVLMCITVLMAIAGLVGFLTN